MITSHRYPTNKQPLKGLRLVVSGYELEQREHRGIAVFTKGMLRSLKEAGAEVWLLSEFTPRMNDMLSRAWLPRAVRRTVFTARLLDQLNSGEARVTSNALVTKLRNLPLIRRWLKLVKWITYGKHLLFPRSRINADQLERVPANELNSSPYQRCERLEYLRDIDGVICASDCFNDSFSLARKRSSQTLLIDLDGFDGFITTSPLNLEPLNTPIFLQTVHDLIPLEYSRTGDHLASFSQRLLATTKANRIYVSEDAEQKFNTALYTSNNKEQKLTHSRVLTQCPSIQFPGDALDWEARTKTVQVYSSDQKQLHNLLPLEFILFNSAVVPHKNLLFALRAYLESGIQKLNIQFCITGQPQRDAYSREVKELAKQQKNVIFTGYVDDATKRRLYLNALALISPSLIEGFGIPVLDAACLGMTTIASPIGSHREIQRMHDFKEKVLLCSTLRTSDWASAMRLTALKLQNRSKQLNTESKQLLVNEIRRNRIRRYETIQREINNEFRKGLCEILLKNQLSE